MKLDLKRISVRLNYPCPGRYEKRLKYYEKLPKSVTYIAIAGQVADLRKPEGTLLPGQHGIARWLLA